MMRRVAVIGVGMTKFGEHWDKGLRDLIAEAGIKALEDANMTGQEIDAAFVGTMASGSLIEQEHVGALIADQMGLCPIPVVRVEGACASGGLALAQGFLAVASGYHDVVVVAGVEKMTDLSVPQVAKILGGAGDQEWETFLGATFPGLYAMIARRHMHEFGTTEEMMAHVSVKNHKNGSLNPNAQFRRPITVEDVLNSKKVAEPLKILDCSPITDGAAVAILCPLELAKKYTDCPIEIVASAKATDTLALHDRENVTTLKATKVAAKKAYERAKLLPKDIDVAEVHDCFTIAEIVATEDLGFFEKGEGGKAVQEGRTDLEGEIAINTSGGLKACGHPVGATGIKQAVEIVWQLRGQAGERQRKDAEIGLTHNVGGTGATAVVHIFKKV